MQCVELTSSLDSRLFCFGCSAPDLTSFFPLQLDLVSFWFLRKTWDQITTSTTTTSTVTMKPLPDISRFRKYNDKYNVMNTPKGAKLFVAGTVGFLVWHHWYYGNPDTMVIRPFLGITVYLNQFLAKHHNYKD